MNYSRTLFKKNNLIFVSYLLIAQPITTQAAEVTYVVDWGKGGELFPRAALVKLQEMDNKVSYFQGEVGHASNGKQRLYFNKSYESDANNCKKSDYRFVQNTTLIFNGQAVNMIMFCNGFSDDKNGTYIKMTPKTERGHVFLIKLFSQSNSPIKISDDSATFYFPVKGFTEVWNSAGGDAL